MCPHSVSAGTELAPLSPSPGRPLPPPRFQLCCWAARLAFALPVRGPSRSFPLLPRSRQSGTGRAAESKQLCQPLGAGPAPVIHDTCPVLRLGQWSGDQSSPAKPLMPAGQYCACFFFSSFPLRRRWRSRAYTLIPESSCTLHAVKRTPCTGETRMALVIPAPVH